MAAAPYMPGMAAVALAGWPAWPAWPVVVVEDGEVNALSWLLLVVMGALDRHADGDPDAAGALALLNLARQDLRCRQRAALAAAPRRLVPAGGGGRP
jgi:hypothetical protein